MKYFNHDVTKLGLGQIFASGALDYKEHMVALDTYTDLIVPPEHKGKSVFPKTVSLSNIDLRYLFFRGLNLIGSTQGTKAEVEDVIYRANKGRVRPLIDVILPFGRIVGGYEKMARDHFEKILVTPQAI